MSRTSTGRPSLPIWDHFDKVNESGVIKAKCRECGHLMTNNAQRMNKHYISLHTASSHPMSNSDDEEASSQNESILTGDESIVSKDSLNDSASSTQTSIDLTVEKPITQKKNKPDFLIQTHIVRTSAANKHEIDIKCGKCFYAANIPFSVTENPAFREFCESMRPGYKPPTRESLILIIY